MKFLPRSLARTGRRLGLGWMCACLPGWTAGPLHAADSDFPSVASQPPTDDRPPPTATVSVDSTFPGYTAERLTDGKWIEKGREPRLDFGHPDRLGNGNNTWVSAETQTEHWIRLDWPEAVLIDEVEICWSLAEWAPHIFRLERLDEDRWVPLGPGEGWLSATDRRTILPFPAKRLRTVRILQPAGGGGARGLLAAQEVRVFHRSRPGAVLSGATRVSSAAWARLKPAPLARDIAALDAHGVPASTPLVWSAEGTTNLAPALVDGQTSSRAAFLSPGAAVGVLWPVPHVIDGGAVFSSSEGVWSGEWVPEVYDGRIWVPVVRGLQRRPGENPRRMEWSFQPVATTGFRLRTGQKSASVDEIEVYRYLPSSAQAWPDHLVQKEGLKQQLLAGNDDPSFEAVALNALAMRSARALLGLQDTTHEIGVAWDGTVQGRETITFRFGSEQYRLDEFPDTVQRRLIDGWRPGVVIQGRLGTLEVRETTFVAPPHSGQGQAVLVVRIAIRNLGDRVVRVPVEAAVQSDQVGEPDFVDGQLRHGGRVLLQALSGCRPGDSINRLCVDLDIPVGAERHADFVQPHAGDPGDEGRGTYSSSYDTALAAFREYWDKRLATPTVIVVPEERLNRLTKAVLAQAFITGDGDIMCYGAMPSVYEGGLFGYEESFPILGLAMFGFGRDAQRYLDGTYLTRAFLAKTERYGKSEDRHQQYRNGLQPHYAVSAYRLNRDTNWIRGHLPLLRECAEWTISQRRRTRVAGDEPAPLHAGLLPKWAYGGDVLDVECYALFGNLCCWRGLVDTAWLLKELGDHDTARRYDQEAREYRKVIDRAIDGSYLAHRHPPFLPLRLYASQPDEAGMPDYYQLFAGCLMDIDAFAPDSTHLRWITQYLEQDNRTFCFLPRFRRDLGPGGLDAIYGKGYLLALLRQDAVREFLLAFYAFLAFNMEHDVFTSRESNVIYASDLHARSSFRPAEITDPVVCSSAVALHALRHLLVSEEPAAPDGRAQELRLLTAVPRAWLQDGQVIRLREVPTRFGPLSLEVRSRVAQGGIEAELEPPRRSPCQTIALRLRHPTVQPIRSVRVNGQVWRQVDPAREMILLPGDSPACRIEARYGSGSTEADE